MGRDLYLYQLSTKDIQEQLPLEIKRLDDSEQSFKNWLSRENDLSYETICQKIAHDPNSLTGSELSQLTTWLWNVYGDANYDESLLARLGLIEVWWEGITCYCNVVIEQLNKYFDQLPERSSPPDYVFTSKELVNFIEWMIILLGHFFVNERMGEDEELKQLTKQIDELGLIHPNHYAQAQKIYKEQLQQRQELGEYYTGKWSTDYFSTAWRVFDLIALRAVVAEANTNFYLLDSY
ncbi:hypothetical protein QNI19_29560 [Cytophagaceae bacterium DM2B3-1]|uniref:Uncharacterized protein n=1 Tax=Xanthocytophaga flava TaxID=3048013 RepID=A0ABT7CW16_9BACT|nr:hypothetical protein [Xanthocytophaga flavus]MDJ1471855.1 hypothetical protein [Xanthocytophaga flavus]MDJ1497122.1 hypothetical protein [Xanthocytophaga flavus]